MKGKVSPPGGDGGYRREFAVLAFMIVATFAASFANYLFNIIAARLLGKEDYGVLASLLSIFIVFSVPTTAIQAEVAKRVALHRAQDDPRGVHGVISGFFLFLALAGLVVFLSFCALSRPLAGFLKMTTPLPLMVLGSAVALSSIYPVALGTLQGHQLFGHLGANMIFQATVRIGLGVLLIKAGWGVSGAMGASTVGLAAAMALALAQGRAVLEGIRDAARIRLRDFLPGLLPVLALVTMFWSFTSLDILIARRVLDAAAAGDYACAVFMGKIVLFLPSAVSMVMFPKTAELHARGQGTTSTLFRYLSVGLLLSGAAGACYLLFPRFLINLLYGSEFQGAASVLGIFGMAMALYSAVNILLLYFISVQFLRLPLLMTLATLALEITVMGAFARSLAQFAWSHMALSASLFTGLLWATAAARRSGGASRV